MLPTSAARHRVLCLADSVTVMDDGHGYPEMLEPLLATRLDGREFEIPSYRYSTLFALDPAAAPSPAALPGLQGRFD